MKYKLKIITILYRKFNMHKIKEACKRHLNNNFAVMKENVEEY